MKYATHGHAAKVISDSVTLNGDRLTTMECTFPRYVLAEFNTHRVFSRNSASSRAIPVQKRIDAVMEHPFIPEFGANQPGMQAGEVIAEAEEAEKVWLEARNAAVKQAQAMLNLGVHKQVANRILEPFCWHTIIVSSTEWDNFFKQRSLHHTDKADPSIAIVATMMEDLLKESIPTVRTGTNWHTPYFGDQGGHESDPEDAKVLADEQDLHLQDVIKWISAARCARVSYETHDGVRDLDKDLGLYNDTLAKYGHWSPMEHVAQPFTNCKTGNFSGWKQLRAYLEAEL